MNGRIKRGTGVKAMWLAGAAIALLEAQAAIAAPAPRHYEIAPGAAIETVQQVAVQSGTQVIAPDSDLRGVRTHAVTGDFTPVEALRRMFAGTGMEVIEGRNGIVTIRRARTEITQADSVAQEEVLVTGSRIERPGFDTLQAATSVDAQEIARRGYTNVLEALQDSPGFGMPGNSQFGAAQSNLGIAQTFANFFGLGSQRTLTLVNGRRFVSSNTISGSGAAVAPGSQVDLNLVPVGLIERVETVAIGGAPVYGSDAIAGTVNVILRKNYQGLQLTAQTGISERGDAANQTVRGLFGYNFAEGRGNVVIGGEYTRQEGMLLSARQPFRYLFPSGAAQGSGTSTQMVVDDLRYAPLSDGGLPYSTIAPYPFAANYIRNAAGQPVTFGSGGDLVPIDPGKSFYGSSIGPIPIYSNGGSGLDPAKHSSLLSPNHRYLFNLNANYRVLDNVTAFVEGSYARTSGTKLSDLFQFAAPNILGGPTLRFNVNNPFLSQQARSILVANGITDFYLNRNLNDIADRFPARTELEVYRIVAGLQGDFQLGGEKWRWDVSYNYGHSRNRSQFNQINKDRLLKAIDVTRDGSGNIVCVSGGDCVPLNLFGENATSDAAVRYVMDAGVGVSTNSMSDVVANVGGVLPFRIAGPIAFNLGYEHREETGRFDANAILAGGLSLLGGGNAYPSAPKSGFHTNEVYGEAVVPLIGEEMGAPLLKSAQFEGAVRYVNHSRAGADVTWSAGGRLQLRGIEGLTLRGVYTRSIRAPSLVEASNQVTPTAGNAADVCDPSRINSGPNPAARKANCAAALAAVGVSNPADFHATTTSVSPYGLVGGNPDLENERAHSYSFGFVYQPPAVRGLRLAVDYSRIRLRNAISRFTLTTAESACYDSPNYPREGACQAFQRMTAAEAAAQSASTGRQRVAGDIADDYREAYYNSALMDFAGIIGVAQYAFEVPGLSRSGAPGQLRLGANVSYIEHYRTQTSGAAAVIEQAGTYASPRWTVTGKVGYGFAPFDLDLQFNWRSASLGDTTLTDADTPVNHYPAYMLVHGTLGLAVTDNFALQFTVRNLLDRKMPYSATVTRAFNVYDPIGRAFQVRASVNF